MVATEFEEETKQILADAPSSVSVVVPSYNHARFVEVTLRSIMKQSRAPQELIVIDDGSTDESPRVIERVLNECRFTCELITRNNRGLCATLNEGFARTRGEYFAYLGSDDVWLPDFIEARVGLLEARTQAVLAYGHAYLIDEKDRIIDSTAAWASYADGDARAMLLQTTAPMSPTVLYRRAALDKHRWNEAAKLEDYDLYLRLSDEGEFAFDPRILSAWRRHGSNVSWDQTLMFEEHLRAQREAALRFGYTEKQIAELQRTTSFNRAEDFMRIGEKSRALGLMMENWRGANSPRATARMMLRLLLPKSFMRGRARVRERNAHKRYGSL